jgi:hypothetical protein
MGIPPGIIDPPNMISPFEPHGVGWVSSARHDIPVLILRYVESDNLRTLSLHFKCEKTVRCADLQDPLACMRDMAEVGTHSLSKIPFARDDSDPGEIHRMLEVAIG